MKNHNFPSRAPGGPGIEPRWTHGAKVAVGTAYSISSRVCYTHDAGCVTEVYYPTIDTPQIRDLQFLFTDGETFFHDERRNFTSEIDCVSEAVLGLEVTNRENEGQQNQSARKKRPRQGGNHRRISAPRIAVHSPKLRISIVVPYLKIPYFIFLARPL